LYENHVDAWVLGCDRLKMNITDKKALPIVEEYRKRKTQILREGRTTAEPGKARTEFSQAAFVDAIVEFVVSDDQVRPLSYLS
jgi:hypothetical protein